MCQIQHTNMGRCHLCFPPDLLQQMAGFEPALFCSTGSLCSASRMAPRKPLGNTVPPTYDVLSRLCMTWFISDKNGSVWDGLRIVTELSINTLNSHI